MTPSERDAFDKAEAVAERARLQQLLDDYDGGRLAHHAAGSQGLAGEASPDRAGKVRARIASLDEIIGMAGDN